MRYTLPIATFTFSLLFTHLVQADQETVTTTVTKNPSGGTTTTVVRKTISTTAPAPKVVVTVPPDYANCFNINAGWFGDVWIAAHQVCQYANSPSGVAWVDGYWQCSQYNLDSGICKTWDWIDAHWVTSYKVY